MDYNRTKSRLFRSTRNALALTSLLVLASCGGGSNSNQPAVNSVTSANLQSYVNSLSFTPSSESGVNTGGIQLNATKLGKQQAFKVYTQVTMTGANTYYYPNSSCTGTATFAKYSTGTAKLSPGTYTTDDSSSYLLCNSYPGGCSGLLSDAKSGTIKAMQFTYNLADGSSVKSACMYNSTLGFDVLANYSVPANPVACTSGPSCGYSQAYTTTLLITESMVTPANNATGVSQSPSIQVQFSQPVKNVVESTVSLHVGSANGATVAIGNITAGSNNTYTFSPSASLSSQTTYYVVLSTDITDVNGNHMADAGQFSFTVGDYNPPTVGIITPANNATNVEQTPSIQVQFNQAVNNVNSTNVTLHSGSATGPTVAIGNLTLGSNNTYSFSPSASLASETLYYVVLSSGITDVYGTALTQTQFSFTTGDFNPPSVSIVTPSNNATNVSQSPSIQVQFNQAVNNVNSTNVTLHSGSATGPTVAIGNLTLGSNNTYSFSPSSSLGSVTLYYVVLGSGITDSYGTALTPTQFSFTTGDFNPPTVSIISPSNNATGVSQSPSIQIQFNEPVLNVNSNVSLHSGSPAGATVAIGTITPGANNTYTFSPSSTLSSQTKYYVVLSSGITDSSGNSLSGTKQFSFTTGDSTPPTVSMLSPTNNASNTSLAPSIQIQFSESVLNVNSTNVTLHRGSPAGLNVAIGTITPSGNTYTFSPTANLSESTMYYVVLSNAITDISGNLLSGTTQFSFTTNSGIYVYAANYTPTGVSLCYVNSSTGNLSGCTTSSGATGISSPKGVVINNGYAYFVNPAAIGSVTACVINQVTGKLSNCSNGGTNISSATEIVISGGYAYINNRSGTYSNTITKCAVSGTSLTNCVNSGASGQTQSVGVGANGSYIYVLANYNVFKCTIGESGVLSVCAATGGTITQSTAMSISNGYAYLSLGTGSSVTICTVNGSTGELSNCADSGQTLFSSPQGITVKGGFAYVTNYSGTYANTITQCAVNASTGALSSCANSGATGASSPFGIGIY